MHRFNNKGEKLQGRVSGYAAYSWPRQVTVAATGERITVDGVCDWEGHSPTEYGTDQDGIKVLLPFNESITIDQRIPTKELFGENAPLNK